MITYVFVSRSLTGGPDSFIVVEADSLGAAEVKINPTFRLFSITKQF